MRRASPGCRSPVAFGLVVLASVVLCCVLGLVCGAVIGELTGGVLPRAGPQAQRRPVVHATIRPTPYRARTAVPVEPTQTAPAPPAEPAVATATTMPPGDASEYVAPVEQPTPVAAAPAAPEQQVVSAPSAGLPANLPVRPATRLVIPALGVDAPVVLIGLQNGTWAVDQLTQEVGHLQGTASPGDASNVAIAGHVTLAQGGDGPFRSLAQLKQGDDVIVFAGEQPFRYLVEQVRVVLPDDVQVTFPTTEPVVTLITCANWNQSRHAYDDRIIAVGRLAP
jgi:sortase A